MNGPEMVHPDEMLEGNPEEMTEEEAAMQLLTNVALKHLEIRDNLGRLTTLVALAIVAADRAEPGIFGELMTSSTPSSTREAAAKIIDAAEDVARDAEYEG